MKKKFDIPLFIFISFIVCTLITLIVCLCISWYDITNKSLVSVAATNSYSLYPVTETQSQVKQEKEEIIVVSLNYGGMQQNNTSELRKLVPIPEIPKYYIKINCSANTITVYQKDQLGNFTVPVKAFACSTGTATPRSGTYPLTSYKANWVPLFGDVYGQYGWQVTGHIMLHSVPYTKLYDKSSLTYYNYDRLGTSASSGCIRLTVADAKWIYDNCIVGTIVEFYSDSNNPGPLGKPETQKISGNYRLRGWDPTDPDPNNPWNT